MYFPVSLAGFFAKSQIMFFFCHHSDSAHRSRMTAEVLLVFYDILTCVRKHAPIASQSSALPSEFGGS